MWTPHCRNPPADFARRCRHAASRCAHSDRPNLRALPRQPCPHSFAALSSFCAALYSTESCGAPRCRLPLASPANFGGLNWRSYSSPATIGRAGDPLLCTSSSHFDLVAAAPCMLVVLTSPLGLRYFFARSFHCSTSISYVYASGCPSALFAVVICCRTAVTRLRVPKAFGNRLMRSRISSGEINSLQLNQYLRWGVHPRPILSTGSAPA